MPTFMLECCSGTESRNCFRSFLVVLQFRCGASRFVCCSRCSRFAGWPSVRPCCSGCLRARLPRRHQFSLSPSLKADFFRSSTSWRKAQEDRGKFQYARQAQQPDWAWRTVKQASKQQQAAARAKQAGKSQREAEATELGPSHQSILYTRTIYPSRHFIPR
jgi:hypothetical protein